MIYIVTPKSRGQKTVKPPKGWVSIDELAVPRFGLTAADADEWVTWASQHNDLHVIGEEADVLRLLELDPELGSLLGGVLGLGRDGRPAELRASALVTTAALFGQFEDVLEDRGDWPADDLILRNIRLGLAAGMKVGQCWTISVPA